jgi:UDP-N-acetylmuramyl pentapeptide phosphotransferase/UDP-N-acetylglucosamine-1-phosphate transferase
VPVFLLGLIDDVRPLSTKVRFLAHVGVAAAFVLLLDPAAPIATELGTLHLHPWIFRVLSGVWIVAVLNIYNFMDGMDGLAGGQTLAAGFALAVIFAVRAPDLALPVGLMAGAAFGFLAHNYPPARIFMGDGCSTFLGFAFATLPLVAHARGASSFMLAPTVLAPFLGDGTFTILRRALAREKFWQAHRTHLYQRAVASGLEHRDVLLVYLAWLTFAAAVAILCHRQPPGMGAQPLLGFALAYAPLALVYLWVRARERRGPAPHASQ